MKQTNPIVPRCLRMSETCIFCSHFFDCKTSVAAKMIYYAFKALLMFTAKCPVPHCTTWFIKNSCKWFVLHFFIAQLNVLYISDVYMVFKFVLLWKVCSVWRGQIYSNFYFFTCVAFILHEKSLFINLHLTCFCKYNTVAPHLGCFVVCFSDFVPFDLSAALHSQH